MLGHSMAVPQAAQIQTLEEIAVVVTASLFLKKPFAAIYNNFRRSFCPHVLGRNKHGDLRVLCYQIAGGSASGLKRRGSPDNWRCVAVPKLRSVRLLDEQWQTAENHARPQSCIEQVLFDTEKLDIIFPSLPPTL
jgi:hypothetical protein